MVLKAYAEKGLTKYAFDNVGKCGRIPSLRSCNCLLSNLVKNGEHLCLCTIRLLGLALFLMLSLVPIMVYAYCKDGRVGRAVEFVEEMERSGFETNVVTYNSLIDGYLSLGEVEGAEGVLKLMSEKGISRSVVSYALLIKGYCKKCEMKEAEKVFLRMKEDESIIVDEQTYGVLLGGYCQAGRMDDAIRIRDQMLKLGLKMNVLIVMNINKQLNSRKRKQD